METNTKATVKIRPTNQDFNASVMFFYLPDCLLGPSPSTVRGSERRRLTIPTPSSAFRFTPEG
jgi:hypothetical protein